MLFSNSSLIFVQWTYVSRKYITLKYQMEIHVCVCMYLCVYVLFCMKRFSKYHNELCKNLLKEKYITESLYWCYSNTHANTMFSEYLILRATFFRERGRGVKERERNIDQREKNQSVASHTHPDFWPNPHPRHMPWPEIEPVTFRFGGRCPTNWDTPVMGEYFIFKIFHSKLYIGMLKGPIIFKMVHLVPFIYKYKNKNINIKLLMLPRNTACNDIYNKI